MNTENEKTSLKSKLLIGLLSFLLLVFVGLIIALSINAKISFDKMNTLEQKLNKIELKEFEDAVKNENKKVVIMLSDKNKKNQKLNEDINEKLKENSKIDDILIIANDSIKQYYRARYNENKAEFQTTD